MIDNSDDDIEVRPPEEDTAESVERLFQEADREDEAAQQQKIFENTSRNSSK